LAASGARQKAGAGAVEMRARPKAGAVEMRARVSSKGGPPKPSKPCGRPQQGARGPPPPRPPRSDTAPKSRAAAAVVAAAAPMRGNHTRPQFPPRAAQPCARPPRAQEYSRKRLRKGKAERGVDCGGVGLFAD
jgi:hypothetical protein